MEICRIFTAYFAKILREKKKIGFFEKYLTLWVALCIGMGISWL